MTPLYRATTAGKYRGMLMYDYKTTAKIIY